MALTEHQEEVLSKSLNILNNENRLLLKGSAGVGKTYLVNELIKRLAVKLTNSKKIYCSAPTNKAVSVLMSKVDANPMIEFITIHSALKLKRFIDNKSGSVYFKPWFDDRYPPLMNVSLLIIDEVSMLNKDLMNYIEEYATKFSVKVIFIGDDKQLNPVGEEKSLVFYKDYPEVELTEIVRQAGHNPIISLSRNLEDIKFREDSLLEEEMIGYLHTINKDKVIDSLAEVNGTNELKYLAYTNQEVDTMNYLVRKMIYGSPGKIELGESLIFNSPYGEQYFTNQEITVEDLGVTTYKFKYIIKNKKISKEFEVAEIELKVYYINGKLEDNRPKGILVIHEDSDQALGRLKKTLYNLAKSNDIEWKDYYGFVESFADLTYNHAITVHKSQGSTFKKAIVNIANLNLNRNKEERTRLLYTAVTRASDLLILYNS